MKEGRLWYSGRTSLHLLPPDSPSLPLPVQTAFLLLPLGSKLLLSSLQFPPKPRPDLSSAAMSSCLDLSLFRHYHLPSPEYLCINKSTGKPVSFLLLCVAPCTFMNTLLQGRHCGKRLCKMDSVGMQGGLRGRQGNKPSHVQVYRSLIQAPSPCVSHPSSVHSGVPETLGLNWKLNNKVVDKELPNQKYEWSFLHSKWKDKVQSRQHEFSRGQICIDIDFLDPVGSGWESHPFTRGDVTAGYSHFLSGTDLRIQWSWIHIEPLSASDEVSGSTRMLFNQNEVPSQANCRQEFRHRLRTVSLHGSLSVLTHEKKFIWNVCVEGEG